MVLRFQYDNSAVYAAFLRRFITQTQQFCCMRRFPQYFTPEMASLAYGLACFVHFAIRMLCEPTFQDPSCSTSLPSNNLSLQSCSNVRQHSSTRFIHILLHSRVYNSQLPVGLHLPLSTWSYHCYM